MANKEQQPTVSNTITSRHILVKTMETTKTTSILPLIAPKSVIEREIILPGSAISQREVELPQEILRHICSYLDQDSLDDLRSCALVSHAYNGAAAVLMFRTVKLSFTRASYERLFNVAKSIKLRNLVLELKYELIWADDITQGFCWHPKILGVCTSYHLQLGEALAGLINVNTLQFHPAGRIRPEEYLNSVSFSQIFDPIFYLLKITLRNVPRLRSIIAAHMLQFKGSSQNLVEFTHEEEEALGRLHNLTIGFDYKFGSQLPTMLSCMSSLRSLELSETGGRDFSEIVNPSQKFHSLASLKLEGFNLNEEYFKQFLLTNARSLRSLSLRNLKIEMTEEEFEAKEYSKSNPWIRMFYFFAQSMNLADFEFSGKLYTTRSGIWEAMDVAKSDKTTLLVRLQNFITHVEGSSFPLPLPDVDLTNINLNQYDRSCNIFFWRSLKRFGTIRLLEREPFQIAVLKGFLEFGERGLDSVEYEDSENEDEYLPDLDVNGLGYDLSESASDGDLILETEEEMREEMREELAFQELKKSFLANKHKYSDEEKKALAELLIDDQTNAVEEGSGSGSATTEEETTLNTPSAE